MRRYETYCWEVLVILALTRPCGGAVSPRNLQGLFLVPDDRVDWRTKTWGKPLTDADRAVIVEIAQLPPLEAVRRLGFFMRIQNESLSNFSRDRLLEVPGWQDALEAHILEIKDSWEHRPNINDEPPPIRDQHGATAGAYSVLQELASVGVTDAVLVAAPFLFDTTEPIPSAVQKEVVARYSSFVMIAAKPLDLPDTGSQLWGERRLTWCKWWIKHAREFGAESPTSPTVPFEEVLELCRAARHTHLNARFERKVSGSNALPEPATPVRIVTPPSQLATSDSKDPSRLNKAEARRTRFFWLTCSAAALMLAFLILLYIRRRLRT